ncbi:hypothetical protein JAAARDRAFT_41177 [Jaapia argillacea MUCL 33604]|uniref:Uncharacterized protein n=1 Tax=Jaapia argillacea MUCL 33604 TaxID=933084 RepID=A0A067P8T7_9AGAM|nr:hypothetical protein JAAARDRAFT_41177 [Jaapia argillacea MUCL 33604]
MRLPPELLSEIFICCLPVPTYDLNPLYTRRGEAPLLVSQICRSWRHVALSCPALWSSFRWTVYPSGSDKSWENGVSVVQEWLRRSGGRPLSIGLDWDERKNDILSWSESDEFTLTNSSINCIDIIAPHAPRWKRIDLNLPTQAFARLRHIGPVPLLEKLTLYDIGLPGRGYESFYPNDWTDFPPFITIAPCLRALRFIIPIPVTQAVLPWHQLTQLILENPRIGLGVNTCLAILSQCTKLVECEVVLHQPSLADSIELPPNSFILPDLEELTIYTTVDISPFFAKLVLPKLASIHLNNGDIDTPWTNRAFLDLIARSSCVLESLKFARAFQSDSDALECFQQIPSLERVDIEAGWEDRVITDYLLGCLTVDEWVEGDDGSPVSEEVAPNMEALTIRGTVYCMEEALSAMIRSRWDPTGTCGRVTCLEEVTLRIEDFVPSDPFLGLKDCIQEGLLLRLGDNYDPIEVDSSLSVEASDSPSRSSS